MTTGNAADAARADLAFLKALAEGKGRPPAQFGKAMLSGGLLHGALVLLYAAHFSGVFVLPPSPALHIVLPFAPSLVWVLYLARIQRAPDRATPTGAHKAINAAFQGVGLVSLATLPAAGLIAWRFEALPLVFIHSMAVAAVLGAAWFVAWRLAGRAWMLGAAIGWLACAAMMGAAIAYASLTAIFLVAAVALLGLLALPGAVMMRDARKEAA